MKPLLQVIIRTPQNTVVDEFCSALRVPTRTGQVGIRAHGEATVLAVEAGLMILRSDTALRFAGTVGGLLHTNRTTASLLTPLAVVGDDVQTVTAQLDLLLNDTHSEMELRRTLGQLENRILQELLHGEESSTRPETNQRQ